MTSPFASPAEIANYRIPRNCLTSMISNYLAYKAENSMQPLSESEIEMSTYTALEKMNRNGLIGSLTDVISTMKSDFMAIVPVLERMGNLSYKDDRIKEGLGDNMRKEREYNCADIARKLNVSLEAVRKQCRKGNIKTQKRGRSYIITESAFREYLKSKNRGMAIIA